MSIRFFTVALIFFSTHLFAGGSEKACMVIHSGLNSKACIENYGLPKEAFTLCELNRQLANDSPAVSVTNLNSCPNEYLGYCEISYKLEGITGKYRTYVYTETDVDAQKTLTCKDLMPGMITAKWLDAKK